MIEDVTVAGCGVAGGFFALRALQLGLKPTLIRVPMLAVGGVEIIPASAGRLLAILELDDVLAALGAGLGDGMVRWRADGATDVSPGRSLHVDRQALRAGVVAEAVRRGAQIRDVRRLPPFDPLAVSVDATGRSAAWSRPVVRSGRLSADIFSVRGAIAPGTGRLAMMERGWAYLAADEAGATAGVVGRSQRPATHLDAETRDALGIAPEVDFHFIGRRPAFVQWASKPVFGRRIAIGDAAMHHNPIGGRGIGFALGSAFAAATAISTWRDDPASEGAAGAYYEGYVAAEVRRHLAFLEAGPDVSALATVLPTHICWIATSMMGEVVVDSRVVVSEVFRVRSGATIRWAGGLDLSHLRAVTAKPVRSEGAVEQLLSQGISVAEARRTLVWALENGLIEAVSPV